MNGCYSFDQKIALNEFKKLRLDCDIVEIIDHECDGVFGECWYVKIRFKSRTDTSKIQEINLQYWKTADGWITSEEYNKLFNSRKHL